MLQQLEEPNSREKRRAILQKAEAEINLAEREVQEWKFHRRESPKILELVSRSNTISDIICKTPNRNSPYSDIQAVSPSVSITERRLKEVEELRRLENDKHRKEIERLEALIDKMQETRKTEPKTEVLQQILHEKFKEIELKNKEINELKNKLKLEERKSRPAGNRCNSHENIEKGKVKTVKKDAKVVNAETIYWKTKAYELSTKFFMALKNIKEDVNKIRADCNSEWKVFRQTYQGALKKLKI